MKKDRLKDIDTFLKNFRQQIIDNPNRINDILSHNNIYGNLVRYYTPMKYNNANLFAVWVKNNQRNNTMVFVDRNWQYFCQFISQRHKMNNSKLHRKIYLSLEPTYLENGVERLFDFLSRENIPHISKVGKLSRDDQVVVRVGNSEDCEKVLNFIDTDPYIQEGKKKPNPFAFQERGVALATDGEVSYNTCMSYLVEIYLREYVDRIDEININTFLDFCVDYYNKYFVKKEDVEKIYHDFSVDNIYELYKIVDYKYCLKLFLNGLSEKFNYKDYDEFVENKDLTYDKEFSKFADKMDLNNYMELFTELCEVMIEKYEQDGKEHIKAFIDTGDSSYITRTNNLRDRVSNGVFINYVLKYAKNNGITIDKLIDSVYQKSKGAMFDNSKSELLKKGVNVTYFHHQQLYEMGKDIGNGYQYAQSAMVRLLRNGKYDGFTRQNNIRFDVKNNITQEDAYNIVMKELGLTNVDTISVVDLANKYIDKVLDYESEKTK